MQPWTTRSRRTLLDLSPWLSVESRVVELPDGRVIEDWPWVESREFANVVAVTEDGLVPRVPADEVRGRGDHARAGRRVPRARRGPARSREARAARGDGVRGARVDAARAVRRRRQPRLRCRASLSSRAARGRSPSRIADDLEEQELLLLTRDEVETALVAGELEVLSWAAAMALALVALDRG